MYAANFKRKNSDLYERHKNFYNSVLEEIPQPPPRRSRMTAPHGRQPLEGAIYSPDLQTFLAPAEVGDFWPPYTPVRSLRTFDCWYSYIDAMPETGATRLNVIMHGFDLNEGESFLRTVRVWPHEYGRGTGPDAYSNRVRNLMRGENVDHIHMLTCFSANGGENAFAAQVAENTGLPVTGYRGEMLAMGGSDVRREIDSGRSPENRIIGVGPLNARMYDGRAKIWRPTVVAKEFRPSFGARGFDDMASFFEGAFLL